MIKLKKYSLLAIALSMLIIGSVATVTAAPPGGAIWTNDNENDVGDPVFQF